MRKNSIDGHIGDLVNLKKRLVSVVSDTGDVAPAGLCQLDQC